jgi:hypothetical protein
MFENEDIRGRKIKCVMKNVYKVSICDETLCTKFFFRIEYDREIKKGNVKKFHYNEISRETMSTDRSLCNASSGK